MGLPKGWLFQIGWSCKGVKVSQGEYVTNVYCVGYVMSCIGLNKWLLLKTCSRALWVPAQDKDWVTGWSSSISFKQANVFCLLYNNKKYIFFSITKIPVE